MTTPSRPDYARFSRPRFLPGVELVSVSYRDRSFPEHSHAEYVVGAVTAGAEILTVQGRPHHAGTGSVLLLHPGEAHANATHGRDTLRYCVLYLPANAIQRHLGPDASSAIAFPEPVTREAGLYRTVCEVHAMLASDEIGQLEQESALAMLAHALASGTTRECVSGAASHISVEKTRRYIDAHFAESFGLQDLSNLTGISMFHLNRIFKKALGLSPLAYRNQRRIVEARRLLLDGHPIAEIAVGTGYADQSHLTRHFQRIVGVSPHRYAHR